MTPKKISLLIAFCMLINNTAIAGVIDAPSFDTKSPVIQTSVFQLASLIRMPFTLTSRLMSEQAPLLPEYKTTGTNKNTEKGNKNDKDRRTAGDYSFFFTNSENSIRTSVRTLACFAAPVCDSGGIGQGAGIMGLSLLFLWLGFKYIFLFACLIALSKSNLPWEIGDTCA
jgi:hypothetical protein